MDDINTAYTVSNALKAITVAYEDPNYKDSNITLHNIQPGCAQRAYELLYEIMLKPPITFDNKVVGVPSATFFMANKVQ